MRLRKRDEWVLPKGKLNDGETPRAAAKREVLEETGHDVCVHEFLGTLVYPSGSRSKVVHYWRMAAANKPAHELMPDVRAVDWLPLDAAVERLSRNYEQAFLANVGPIALKAASVAEAARRKAKQPAPEKRRTRRITPLPAVPPPLPEIPAAATAVSELAPEAVEPSPMELPASPPALSQEVVQGAAEEPAAESMPDEPAALMNEAAEADTLADASTDTADPEIITELAEPGSDDVTALESSATDTGSSIGTLVQKMRHWLRRAA